MEVWILDENYQNTYVVDSFESLIWTESYIEAGDFELIFPINDYTISIVTFIRTKRLHHLDTFASINESDHVMIVEKVELTTDFDKGARIMLVGRSLESLLERRLIWNVTKMEGNFQNMIERLLNENVINPSIPERRIPNFRFERSNDPKITGLTLSKQYTGDNLYDAMIELCNLYELGYHISLNADVSTPYLTFTLYAGQDRSYDQTDNQYVIFSPGFENLITSSLLEDVTTYRSVTLVAGEDKDQNRKTLIVNDPNPYLNSPGGSGLSRRELYTDARDIQSETYSDSGEPQPVPDDIYYGYLRTRGEEKLADNRATKEFEGEVEYNQVFKYGQDFTRGDIVQVETEYNVTAKMRIMKFVRSQDETGIKAYPVFKILD